MANITTDLSLNIGYSTPSSRPSRVYTAKQSQLQPSTRLLLKKMMKSSKLSNLQCQFLDNYLDTGHPLPPLARARESEIRNGGKRAVAVEEWFSRPTMRTQAQIKSNGDYEVPKFRTTPKKNMDAEKQKFMEKLVGVDKKDSFMRKSTNKDIQQEEELDEYHMCNC